LDGGEKSHRLAKIDEQSKANAAAAAKKKSNHIQAGKGESVAVLRRRLLISFMSNGHVSNNNKQ
jgi:hypothetical protein